MRMQGKVALITGAARGIGAQIATAFAEAGAAVVLTDVLAEQLEATAAQLRANGARALAIAHDVADEVQWENAIAEAIGHFGGLSVLVNNAGIEKLTFLADCTVEEFERIQKVNVTGVFLGVKHAIRAMRPGGAAGHGGAIINMSSVAGIVGSAAAGAYCASKGAVRLLTKCAALECAQLGYGIRVNSIHPGLVRTDMASDILNRYVELGAVPDVATAEALVKQTHPLGMGSPRDIAGAALFLASDDARWVNAAEIVVDGGFSAQ